MVDLTSETCRTIVSYHADKNEASFRNGIDHHDDQMRDYHHYGVLDSPSGRGVQMVIMPYLLTIMVDLTSETCRTIVSYHADKNEASFRNGIDHHDDQMCDYRHSGVLDPPSEAHFDSVYDVKSEPYCLRQSFRQV